MWINSSIMYLNDFIFVSLMYVHHLFVFSYTRSSTCLPVLHLRANTLAASFERKSQLQPWRLLRPKTFPAVSRLGISVFFLAGYPTTRGLHRPVVRSAAIPLWPSPATYRPLVSSWRQLLQLVCRGRLLCRLTEASRRQGDRRGDWLGGMENLEPNCDPEQR